MAKYLFETPSGIKNFNIGDIPEFISGDRISVSNATLTIRKSISDYIKININNELEYVGTFVNILHKAKGPCKLFKVLDSGEGIYIKPYSKGFYVSYVLEKDLNKYVYDRVGSGDIFITDEKIFYNREV